METELKLDELRLENFRKTLDQLHTHASSVLSLTLQWKKFEDQFQHIHYSIEERMKELKSYEDGLIIHNQLVEGKLKRINIMEELVDEKWKDLEHKESDFTSSQRLAIGERQKEIDSNEEASKQLKLAKELMEKTMNELKKRELELELMNKRINYEDFRRNQKRFDFEVKSFLVDVQDFRAQEKRFEARVEEFNLEKEQERRKELAKEEYFRECTKKLELKEKGIEKRCKEVELKEKKFEEILREAEEKQKKLEQFAREIELKEKNLASPPSTEASAPSDSEKGSKIRSGDKLRQRFHDKRSNPGNVERHYGLRDTSKKPRYNHWSESFCFYD